VNLIMISAPQKGQAEKESLAITAYRPQEMASGEVRMAAFEVEIPSPSVAAVGVESPLPPPAKS
jgi:hypothetical protein